MVIKMITASTRWDFSLHEKCMKNLSLGWLEIKKRFVNNIGKTFCP